MNCQQNIDPLKLVREGTSQPQRALPALDPAFAPVNERTPAHLMVFARAYAAYLKFYNGTNNPSGDWQRFFANDVSVLLSNAAIQNVGFYSTRMQEIFGFLNNLDNETNLPGLRNHLGHLFATIGSMAKALDVLKETLPHEIALKTTLTNLIATQLAPGFRRLIAYQKFGLSNTLLTDVPPTPVLQVLGTPVGTFAASIGGTGLSKDWITDASPNWATFVTAVVQDGSVYGTGATLFEKNNHIATHNLFTAIFDQFLKTYARTVSDAKAELEKTLTEWDKHDPSYTLFLAFVRLNEFARQETNTLTARHLDFYYREILQLKEKPATPGQAHLLLELAKHIDQHLVETGEDFKAGKDDKGIEAFFGSDRDFVANKAKVVELKTLYRHVNRPGDTLPGMNQRLFASPVANSSDGLGAPIDTEPQAWHPFFNKTYFNGALGSINMPRTDLGLAVASHYLFMAEGTRTITLDFEVADLNLAIGIDLDAFFTAFLTTKEGWLEKSLVHLKKTSATNLQVQLVLSGNDPAIIPYNVKTHGYQFGAELPVLRLMMRQNLPFYLYVFFQSARISSVAVTVDVKGLKTLSVANDFGSVDTSKPFLPFGAIPIAGNKFVIGSKEIFQKLCTDAKLNIGWQDRGKKFVLPNSSSTTNNPGVKVSYLQNGIWGGTENDAVFGSVNAQITLNNVNNGVVDKPNFTDPEEFTAGAPNGFFRIALDSDMGHTAYQTTLRDYLIDQSNGGSNPVTNPGTGPTASIAQSLSLDYVAKQTIPLSSTNASLFQVRKARFHHIGPFGDAERHAYLAPLSGNVVDLLPQFDFMRDGIKKESIAEFYIGISDLVPPQNLALLFQVLDGTADPLAKKPEEHVHWSFMVNNEWKEFATEQVEDLTGALMRSGVVTLTFPREATKTNTILPTGKYWVRLAVSEKAEATCQLLLVAAQALLTTFEDKGNDPAFPAKVVPAGTIAKLAVPDAAIKKVQQPFDSFNGRGAEASPDFYRRVSERLRHKDRAITLWDYEHLILEAFPYVYRAKCLNHTEYEPTETGLGVYRELAPGHVTIVTLPDQSQQNVRNPLRPYTSLGTLLDIEAFLKKRTSCFVKLHVKNPQFEEIKTEFKVRFFPGFDETFYLKKLQEDITRFLSPWAFPGGGLPSFGGKVYASVLLNFIEERPWVDYVADFKLRHKPSNSATFSQALTEAEASTAVSVLVSVPAIQHTITLITTAEAEAAAEKCPCEA